MALRMTIPQYKVLAPVTEMRSIQDFPSWEVQRMLRFFHDLEQHTHEREPYSARARYHGQGSQAGADEFERTWWTYAQIFRKTHYRISLSVSYGAAVGDKATVVFKGHWTAYPFMLRQVINLIVDVDICALAREPVAMTLAINRLLDSMPKLERIHVRVQVGPYIHTARDKIAGLCFLLGPLATATGIAIDAEGVDGKGNPIDLAKEDRPRRQMKLPDFPLPKMKLPDFPLPKVG